MDRKIFLAAQSFPLGTAGCPQTGDPRFFFFLAPKEELVVLPLFSSLLLERAKEKAEPLYISLYSSISKLCFTRLILVQDLTSRAGGVA